MSLSLVSPDSQRIPPSEPFCSVFTLFSAGLSRPQPSLPGKYLFRSQICPSPYQYFAACLADFQSNNIRYIYIQIISTFISVITYKYCLPSSCNSNSDIGILLWLASFPHLTRVPLTSPRIIPSKTLLLLFSMIY